MGLIMDILKQAMTIAENWNVKYTESGEYNSDVLSAIEQAVHVGRILALESVLKDTAGTDANFRLKHALILSDLKEKYGL